jgi:hypothetical protein
MTIEISYASDTARQTVKECALGKNKLSFRVQRPGSVVLVSVVAPDPNDRVKRLSCVGLGVRSMSAPSDPSNSLSRNDGAQALFILEHPI